MITKETYPVYQSNGYTSPRLIERTLEDTPLNKRVAKVEDMINLYKRELFRSELNFETRDVYERRLAGWIAARITL
jgi:hypothetical protein